jgi:hypothetical protein
MARISFEKYKKQLPGKIIGFHHNNITVLGDEIASPAAPAAQKTARDENALVHLFLCQINQDIPPSDPSALPNPQAPASTWFNPPYPSLSGLAVPAGVYLMTFLLTYAADDASPAPSPTTPTSYISNVVTSDSGLAPAGIPDWLRNLTFGGTAYNYEEGDLELITDEDGNYIGAIWTGKSWMYFLGSPQNPFPYVPQDPNPEPNPHPSPYPDLRLDQFSVSNLPITSDNGNRAFTLSYETLSVYIDLRTSQENGETVHRLSYRDKPFKKA